MLHAIFIIISVFLCTASIADAQTASSNGTLTTLNKQHPRLLATAEDFERLKKEIGTDRKKSGLPSFIATP